MDLLTLLVKITADSSEYDRALKDAEGEASSFGDKAKSVLGSGIATAAKVGVAAIGAATTAVGALAKTAVDGYAEYEQLWGGVQKLYGNMGASLEEYAQASGRSIDEVRGEWQNLETAQQMVLQNANNAYATAGMSANKYMETATSFSAALINSLGGDTVKAAEQTDVAMRAISDNFNTFGGDITNVQNAFQGFAKQNYTMLDNLKLGYGGTKTEMERLIADANEYAAANGQAADLTIDSFSDVVTAIDLIQQKQNIAGTTAREAGATVAGSIGSVSAAWENLVAGFANPDADLGQLIDNVIVSAEGAFTNMIPVAQRALEGIGRAVTDALPQLLGKIPTAINEMAVPMLEGGVKLVTTLADGLMSAGPKIISTATGLISDLAGNIRDNFSEFITVGAEGVGDLAQGLVSGAGELLSAGLDLVSAVAIGFADGLPALVQGGVDGLMMLVDGISGGLGDVLSVGIDIIDALVNGIIDSLPAIIAAVPEVISAIISTIGENLPTIIEGGVRILTSLVTGIIETIPTLRAAIPQIVEAIWNGLTSIDWLGLGKLILTATIQGIVAIGSALLDAVRTIGQNAWNSFKNIDWQGVGKSAITFILNGIKMLFVDIPNALQQIGDNAKSKFKNIDWISVGKSVVQGLIKGVTALGSTFVNAIVELGKGALNGIKSFFGIHSPSTVMKEQVGEQLALGMIEGVQAEKDAVVNASIDMGVSLANGIADGIEKTKIVAKKRVAKSAQEIGAEVLTEAKNRLKTQEATEKLSLKAEMTYWDEVRKQIEEGTKARADADAQYVKAREAYQKEIDSINSQMLSDAQKTLDNYKVYYQMSLQEEVAYWSKIRDQFEVGTQSRIDADKKLFDAQLKYEAMREKLYTNSSKLTKKFNEEYAKAFQDGVDKLEAAYEKYDANVAKVNEKLRENLEKNEQKLAENLAKVEEDYKKEVEKINDDLAKDIEKVAKAYEDSVEKRFSSIMGMTGLFDTVKKDEAKSKGELMAALKDQVSSLEAWDAELDKLADRIGQNNPLMEQIQSMGISSLGTIEQLNKMSEKELAEYVSLYEKKRELAMERSTQENEQLRQQSEAEIEALKQDAEAKLELAEQSANDLRKKYNDEAAELRKQYQEDAKKDLDDLQKDLDKTAKEIKDSSKQKMEELKAQYVEDLNDLADTCKEEGDDVGTLMMQGMQEGIENMSSSVSSTARKVALQAYQAAMDALDIHSPSKKFAWIGEMVDKGFAEGIANGTREIESQMRESLGFEDITSNMRATMARGSRDRANKGYTQNITINSPSALSPFEIARQTRNATRNMVLSMGGV